MIFKFLKATGLFLGYMGILALGLVLFFDPNLLPSATTIVIVTVVLIVTFPFVMEIISRWSFRFQGVGSPIALEQLKMQILAINHSDIPVVVTEKKGKLFVTWKYLDARWWEPMQKHGITQSYTLLIRFDDKHHRVTLIDIMKSVSWGMGPEDVHVGFGFFRGLNPSVEIGKAWGINEQFKPGVLYDYHFSSGEIRNPILNTILRSGWDVQLGMF